MQIIFGIEYHFFCVSKPADREENISWFFWENSTKKYYQNFLHRIFFFAKNCKLAFNNVKNCVEHVLNSQKKVCSVFYERSKHLRNCNWSASRKIFLLNHSVMPAKKAHTNDVMAFMKWMKTKKDKIIRQNNIFGIFSDDHLICDSNTYTYT